MTGNELLEVLMHPTLKSTIGLLVAAVVLFALSYSGQPYGPWTSGPSLLGIIGWVGFWICLLLLIVSGLRMLIARIRHHDSPSKD
jgi:hypothetical protein